jgi:3-deoxy-manno-octulosonate cytidylyltransferase (CMP-KDO synthetase)
MNKASVLGVIPARFASTRLPGKLLKEICGKTVLQRVYEQCLGAKTLDKIIIVTDHIEIYDHARNIGAEVVMSKKDHKSGTDRISEAVQVYLDYTHVVNIQGDEPFIDPTDIDKLTSLLINKQCEIASLATAIRDVSLINNPNVVKLVVDREGRALYFSRAGIPFMRDPSLNLEFNWIKHIGIYGFKREVLLLISQLPPSRLELIESLEQLRWLENGYQIFIEFVDHHAIGIDTEEDLNEAILYANQNWKPE